MYDIVSNSYRVCSSLGIAASDSGQQEFRVSRLRATSEVLEAVSAQRLPKR